MQTLYSISIAFYYLAIKLAAFLGIKKAKLWVNGRKNWKSQLKQINPLNQPLVWIHVASLGEFEQARPLIELIKERKDCYILLSFFSPSGYEIRKNYDRADSVIYLPHDSKSNAREFIQIINPNVALFIKYEFWYNYLGELKKHDIPTYLVSGIFREKQHFFKFYGSWFRKKLTAFHHFFLQNENSEKLLLSIHYSNTSVIGDTRMDRVIAVSKEKLEDSRFSSFSNNSRVIVFGSSWEKENDFAVQLSERNNSFKLIIAPHEIKQEEIELLKRRIKGIARKLSETSKNEDLSNVQVLIIDSIGLLSKLYRFAFLSFIGGGFGSGIHNLPEAAVYGSPVVFGPNYRKFQEAISLIELKGGTSVSTFAEFYRVLENYTQSEETYELASKTAKEYIFSNSGASEKVMNKINDLL